MVYAGQKTNDLSPVLLGAVLRVDLLLDFEDGGHVGLLGIVGNPGDAAELVAC